MKQTKRFLSVLRMAAEIAAILLIVVCVAAVCMDAIGILNFVLKLWPYVTMVFVAYIMISLSEDFVNNRILRPRC